MKILLLSSWSTKFLLLRGFLLHLSFFTCWFSDKKFLEMSLLLGFMDCSELIWRWKSRMWTYDLFFTFEHSKNLCIRHTGWKKTEKNYETSYRNHLLPHCEILQKQRLSKKQQLSQSDKNVHSETINSWIGFRNKVLIHKKKLHRTSQISLLLAIMRSVVGLS